MTVSPHAAAARYILLGLAEQGIYVESVDEAITRGYLTDLHWCDVLDDFRERYPVPNTRIPGGRTDRRIQARERAQLRREDREASRRLLLDLITRHPGLGVCELARRAELPPESALRLVNEMKAAGLVTCAPGPGRQRARLCYPSPERAA